ncbi:MAG: uroporphyrinogen-III C-methyltransferase [Gammaproteobacteria bacterium]|nr:uroporphyrinogen-III C-methyltransferase [Gammaproteobacteria bacterium]MCP5137139.1 uroporphyrinogen-III C-methyltransferase [Gammaproteobacteria bacterium]
MDYLPIFMKITGRPCLVVGGGDVAARKVSLLLAAGGKVTVVSPKVVAAIAELVDHGAIEHIAREFDDADMGQYAVVIAATDVREVNERVGQLACTRHIPVNVADDQTACSFIMPAMINRDPVQIAVSTGGASPVLARLLRSRLEAMIPAAYGKLAALVESYRDEVKQRFPAEDRRAFWERIIHGPIAELTLAGRDEAARAALQDEIDRAEGKPQHDGEVYLVGAGPGDPDLLTFRALRLMQKADVVLYDRLVAKEILALVRRDAERIYVGKERDNHAVPQDQINQLLADLAKQGKRVLRLKGGDPFIFGRGGEEIELLAEQGVNFQVVPGVTAAAGCASYAGIPLTHRDYSQAAVFVTGHLKDGSIDLNWPALAQPNQTVVFYMGLKGAPVICRNLIENGLPDSTPIALVQQGTTQNQRVFTGTLATLPEILADNEIHAPTLIIVGNVVSLQNKLAWFKPTAQLAQT